MPFKSILLFNLPTSLLWHTGVFNLLVHIHVAKKCQNKDLNWDYHISETSNCVLLKERDFGICDLVWSPRPPPLIIYCWSISQTLLLSFLSFIPLMCGMGILSTILPELKATTRSKIHMFWGPMTRCEISLLPVLIIYFLNGNLKSETTFFSYIVFL